MTIFEKLRTGTPEEITDLFCGDYCKDCDGCPSFISERCSEEKNGFLEWLNKKAKTPKNAQKEWVKSRNEFCREIGDCDMCPPSISWHCKEAFKAMEAWRKPQEPNDVPNGWIKLKTTQGDICIDASRIVGLGHTSTYASVAMNGATTKVYTIGAEDDPWFVYDTINEVMEKIKKGIT